MRSRQLLGAAAVVLLALLITCGGGGSSSSAPPASSGPPLSITTNSILPGTLQNHTYSVTLAAANGNGALTWSIAPISSTTVFVDGLSIDPHTGVLSGTVNFSGTAGFIAQVTDSASPPQVASKGFSISANGPLQAPAPQTSTIAEFQDIGGINPVFQGGVFPFSFSLTGTIPPGLRLDRASGRIFGSATVAGDYSSTLIIQDSFSP